MLQTVAPSFQTLTRLLHFKLAISVQGRFLFGTGPAAGKVTVGLALTGIQSHAADRRTGAQLALSSLQPGLFRDNLANSLQRRVLQEAAATDCSFSACLSLVY